MYNKIFILLILIISNLKTRNISLDYNNGGFIDMLKNLKNFKKLFKKLDNYKNCKYYQISELHKKRVIIIKALSYKFELDLEFKKKYGTMKPIKDYRETSNKFINVSNNYITCIKEITNSNKQKQLLIGYSILLILILFCLIFLFIYYNILKNNRILKKNINCKE